MVVSVLRTGCMSMFGIIVEAARVDGAYVEGAYLWVDLASIERAEVERLEEWPLVNGMLGRRKVDGRSMPNEELRLELDSK